MKFIVTITPDGAKHQPWVDTRKVFDNFESVAKDMFIKYQSFGYTIYVRKADFAGKQLIVEHYTGGKGMFWGCIVSFGESGGIDLEISDYGGGDTVTCLRLALGPVLSQIEPTT